MVFEPISPLFFFFVHRNGVYTCIFDIYFRSRARSEKRT